MACPSSRSGRLLLDRRTDAHRRDGAADWLAALPAAALRLGTGDVRLPGHRPRESHLIARGLLRARREGPLGCRRRRTDCRHGAAPCRRPCPGDRGDRGDRPVGARGHARALTLLSGLRTRDGRHSPAGARPAASLPAPVLRSTPTVGVDTVSAERSAHWTLASHAPDPQAEGVSSCIRRDVAVLVAWAHAGPNDLAASRPGGGPGSTHAPAPGPAGCFCRRSE